MLCIGYVGYEAFDIILYIGRTITKLNHRVLIVDISETGALYNSIVHGMDLDSKKEIVNYRNINYTRKIPTEKELSVFVNGTVIVSFGYNYKEGFPIPLQFLNMVVNTFPNVIEEVNLVVNKITLQNVKLNILIRDAITRDDVDRVKSNFKLTVKAEKIDFLYFELSDYKNAVECQIHKLVRFTKITPKMEKYIIDQVVDMFQNEKQLKVKIALKAARKGI